MLESDATDVIEILGDQETAKLGGIKPIVNMDEAVEYATRNVPDCQMLAIVRNQITPEVVGIIEVYPKYHLFGPFCIMDSYCLGYYTKKSERGNGYMTEAVSALKSYLFDEGISELTVGVFPRNEASRKVALKCGLSSEGVIEGFLEFSEDEKEDVEFFSQINPIYLDN